MASLEKPPILSQELLSFLKSTKMVIPKGDLYEMAITLYKYSGIQLFHPQTRQPLTGKEGRQDIPFNALYTQDQLDGEKCLILAVQDIPVAIKEGIVDWGICGYDLLIEKTRTPLAEDAFEIIEFGASEEEKGAYLEEPKGNENAKRKYLERAGFEPILNLEYSPIVFALGVDRRSIIKDLEDLRRREGRLTIATEFPWLLSEFLRVQQINAKIVPTTGASEAWIVGGLTDGVFDVVSTGSSFEKANIRAVALVMKSTPWFVANPNTSQRSKIFFQLLRGVLF